MRHAFIALAFGLLASAAAAQDTAAAKSAPVRSGAELIKASTLGPQAPEAPTVQVAALATDGLPPDTGAVSAEPLELALAALAVMTGIALRRTTTGQR